MTTREIVERLPEAVRWALEDLRKDYKNPCIDRDATRAKLAGYVNGLRDAGLITKYERGVLFVYGTV